MGTAYCFDLDGTLTRQELLPLIASSIGLEDEISVLTEATMSGLLPFDKSFKLRVRLLRDANLDWIHQALRDSVQFDTEILNFIASRPKQCFVVTGNLDVWVKPMLDSLGIQNFTSIAKLKGDGSLDGVEHVLNKADAIKMLRQDFSRIVAIGEGMNDVPMFELSDWRISFGGVHKPNPTLIKLSDFVVYDGKSLCRLLSML